MALREPISAMQIIGEVVLPETKPATEWISDRPVQKSMPTYDHGKLQLAFAKALEAWAADRGTVATEWRFRVSPPGEDIRPYIPDVTYMSWRRFAPLSAKDRQAPSIAPEIIVEILSPDDRPKDVDEKRRVYFAWGVTLELIADPETRTIDVYDIDGGHERISGSLETYSPAIMPELHLPLRAIFADLDVPTISKTIE